jgi:pimeloyl-ACP methyl ester carboxylesterase
VEQRFFRAGPVSLNVAVGSPTGPPLILLHGVTRRWQDFASLLPGLAPFYRVHAFDLRGHGQSGRTPGAYRVIDYVEDIVSYVNDRPSDRPVLLGHSLGAMVAAAVAARLPGRVRALVLEDPTFEMTASRRDETSFPDLFRAFQPHAGSTRPAAEIAACLADAPIRVPGQPGHTRLGDLRDAVSLRFSASCLKRLDPDVLTTPLEGRWLDSYDVATTLRAVACPTLFLQADNAAGGALPDDHASELAGAIGDVIHLRLAGIGHNIHGTRPETMLLHLLGFLASLD